MKRGKRTEFIKDYRNKFSEEQLKKIWNRSYRYAKMRKERNPNEFLTAEGTEKTISSKALNLAKEYARFGSKSRIGFYSDQSRNLSSEERMHNAEYFSFNERLNFSKHSEKSFMEKYDNEDHKFEGTTIGEMLEKFGNKEISKEDLNSYISRFKEYYSDEFKSKEYYETYNEFER